MKLKRMVQGGLIGIAVLAAGLAQAGPVTLMGIDAEDGGVGGHGPISAYESVVQDLLNNVTNGGSGILVVGGGKSATDDVTEFWNQIGTDLGVAITYVNGAGNITAQSFGGFALLAMVSSDSETSSGGMTQAESDAINARAGDVASFINGGGGLIGFTQDGLTSPYGYITQFGAITAQATSYSDVTSTAAGQAVGITDTNLDVCCWHEVYPSFPPFLAVLAIDNETGTGFGMAAAIGGASVVVRSTQIPTLGGWGVGLLVLLVVLGGAAVIRRL